MKIFTAGPSTIHIARQTELCCRTLWQSFERSSSLDDFEASTIENAAAVSNLDNIAMCFFCFSTCHEGDFGQYMNNRRVHEDTDSSDTDHTVRSFWDRFIDLYITMFLNFMEACKSANNCMLTSLPCCIPYY